LLAALLALCAVIGQLITEELLSSARQAHVFCRPGAPGNLRLTKARCLLHGGVDRPAGKLEDSRVAGDAGRGEKQNVRCGSHEYRFTRLYGERENFFANLFGGFAMENAGRYAEAVRRSGAMVTVNIEDESK
jgi:hypothetical protein